MAEKPKDGELLHKMGADAQLWAEEFAKLYNLRKVVGSHPNDSLELDTLKVMTTWFANAIETGANTKAMPDPRQYQDSEIFIAGVIASCAPFDKFHPAWALPIAREVVDHLDELVPSEENDGRE